MINEEVLMHIIKYRWPAGISCPWKYYHGRGKGLALSPSDSSSFYQNSHWGTKHDLLDISEPHIILKTLACNFPHKWNWCLMMHPLQSLRDLQPLLWSIRRGLILLFSAVLLWTCTILYSMICLTTWIIMWSVILYLCKCFGELWVKIAGVGVVPRVLNPNLIFPISH